jgi:hypothetical protein
MTKKELIERVDNLLDNRGLTKDVHVSVSKFRTEMAKSIFWYFDTDEEKEEVLSILEDESKLIDSSVLEKNFKGSFIDYLVPIELRNNKIFIDILKDLILIKGKGIGAGELVLPLLIKGYRYSNKSDGTYGKGLKSELKNITKKSDASLKLLPTKTTNKGLVDKLNKEIFNGERPGLIDKNFDKFISQVNNPKKQFGEYFERLYPTIDTTKLVENVVKSYKDRYEFNRIVGEFAIREYQKLDGWNNLTLINPDTLQVVNVSNTSDLSEFNFKYTPKFKRGGDSQAIPDGYVNINIKY